MNTPTPKKILSIPLCLETQWDRSCGLQHEKRGRKVPFYELCLVHSSLKPSQESKIYYFNSVKKYLIMLKQTNTMEKYSRHTAFYGTSQGAAAPIVIKQPLGPILPHTKIIFQLLFVYTFLATTKQRK